MHPHTMASWQQAERLLQSGQPAQAGAIYQALAAEPELAAICNLRLSLIASREGDLRLATARALAAWEAKGSDPDLLDMVCKRLYSLGELGKAVDVAMSPAMLASRNPIPLAELGKLMSDAMLPEQALTLVRRSRELGLDSAAVRYLLGLNLMYAGRVDEAEAELEAALRQDPRLAHAAWTLAKLRTQTPDSNHVERLRDALASMGEERGDAVLLHYALFKELDDLGRHDEAWASLERGMRLRRAQVRYDADATRALFEHLAGVTGKPSSPPPSTADEATPIFIVGMPRSGTTLLERILGAHAQVADAGELHDFTRQLRWVANRAGSPYLDLDLAMRLQNADLAQAGRRYIEQTRWRSGGKAFFTDKMPANFLNLGYIAQALPHARILHMVREPMDTCFSNLKEFFAGPYAHSYDQVEMADYYLRYQRLMDHWRTQFPGRILDVHYDQLASDPERVAREVLGFCGLPWQEGLLDIQARTGSVATASAMQVREPIRRRSSAQWAPYAQYLEPMRVRLEAGLA